MNIDPWRLVPLVGLGQLRFGQSLQTARPLMTVYGASEGDVPVSTPLDIAEETFRMPGMGLSEEEIQQLLATVREQNAVMADTLIDIRDGGVSLTFGAAGLNDVMADRRALQLHIDGLRFFGVDPLPALRRLQQLNKARPLIRGPDCYFANIFVTAFECVRVLPNGLVRATAENSDEASQKTIGWRDTERNPGEDFSKHLSIDLG